MLCCVLCCVCVGGMNLCVPGRGWGCTHRRRCVTDRTRKTGISIRVYTHLMYASKATCLRELVAEIAEVDLGEQAPHRGDVGPHGVVDGLGVGVRVVGDGIDGMCGCAGGVRERGGGRWTRRGEKH